jgi:hypothetical protein
MLPQGEGRRQKVKAEGRRQKVKGKRQNKLKTL